jgi:hypothetical protein
MLEVTGEGDVGSCLDGLGDWKQRARAGEGNAAASG